MINVFLVHMVMTMLVNAGDINWYSANNLSITDRLISDHGDVVDGIILCCDLFMVGGNGTITMNPETNNTVMDHLVKYPQKKFYLMGGANDTAFNRDPDIKSLASLTNLTKLYKNVSFNFSGVIIHFEPSLKDRSDDLALRYNKWLTMAHTQFKNVGVKVGMDISQYGVLGKSKVYARTKLDLYTNKDTYTNTGFLSYSVNIKHVDEQVKIFGTKRSRVGIESVLVNAQKLNKNSGWSPYFIEMFVTYLKNKGVQGIDVWRADMGGDEYHKTDDFFIDSLKRYKDLSATVK